MDFTRKGQRVYAILYAVCAPKMNAAFAPFECIFVAFWLPQKHLIPHWIRLRKKKVFYVFYFFQSLDQILHWFFFRRSIRK